MNNQIKILILLFVTIISCDKNSIPTSDRTNYKFFVVPDSLYFTDNITSNKIHFEISPHADANWRIYETPYWLSFENLTGSVSNKIKKVGVNLNTNNLPTTRIKDTVVIEGGIGGNANLIVFFSIENNPEIEITPPRLEFLNSITKKELLIKNIGTGELIWSIINTNQAVIFQPNSGSLQKSKSISIDVNVDKTQFQQGTYDLGITINSNALNSPIISYRLRIEVL